MSDWIKLDKSDFFDKSFRDTSHGENLDVFMSPYDIPEAIKCEFDDSEGEYQIDLKYLSYGEPLREVKFNNEVVICLGRHSRRIYRIIMHSNDSRLTVEGLLNAVFKQLSETALDKRQVESLNVTREIISSKENELCATV